MVVVGGGEGMRIRDGRWELKKGTDDERERGSWR